LKSIFVYYTPSRDLNC